MINFFTFIAIKINNLIYSTNLDTTTLCSLFPAIQDTIQLLV